MTTTLATPAPTQARPPAETAISIGGLSYAYGKAAGRTQALEDIDLDIGRGEIVILTGPSGSGKTTLLTLIGALRRADTGVLRVLGRDLARLGRDGQTVLRCEVGFIFQFHNLFSSLTALENVRMASALKPGSALEQSARAEAMLARLGLRDRLDHKPAQLSGGQNQRVAIARALVNEPALVLADEPTASLDAASGQEVLDILHQFAAGPARTTVLIVTHDPRVIERSDRIVHLLGGRIVKDPQPAARPATKSVQPS
jgi:putative ABC transport system ATP-binding protein